MSPKLFILCLMAMLVKNSIPENSYICHLQKIVGPCRAKLPRYYYDMESGRCEKFYYGGCGGNENNFRHRKECEFVCDPIDPICSLPPDGGICLARFVAYYYDEESRECKKFIYGGCGGNENRFYSKQKCEAACVKTNKIE
ncbi:kappaPI-stichotoxin-Shd2a-like [Physella acuta]|uniref:kappaPI-stichotoxin-Shd2a-like n=1 Tax=Physella acuta TaxID=109671 RepID=UPI0027DCF8E9|nr:kappaPI-stichotoxin-Shd2a-like [Physella acuta]